MSVCAVCFKDATEASDGVCQDCRGRWMYTCPLCKRAWRETVRAVGACPGCGAGWEEMGRVAIRKKVIEWEG